MGLIFAPKHSQCVLSTPIHQIFSGGAIKPWADQSSFPTLMLEEPGYNDNDELTHTKWSLPLPQVSVGNG